MFTWEQGSRTNAAEVQINHRSGTVGVIHPTSLRGAKGEAKKITNEAAMLLADRLGPAAGGG